MRGSAGTVAAGAVLILLALSLAILTPSLGTVVTFAGLVLLVAFLVVAFRGARNGDERRAGRTNSHRNERTGKRK